ncbi:MAG: hypothetical protein OQK73_13305 [Gammaproteobacteria bacterium]|nr:hypothetical protein [Gammaproteobacteria bacterium]
MQFDITEEERKQARHPHEIFLINLVTNHILVFIALLGLAKTYPLLLLVTPVISISIMSYLLFRARRSLKTDSWFQKCHWQLCRQRSRFFIAMLGIMGLVILAIVLISGGEPKPQHYAIGGVGILPTLLSVLALIIMESDAMHQAGHGRLPDAIVKRFPNPDARVIED